MNNTLAQGLDLLELLSESAEPHTVTSLARHFGLAKSQVCRVLKTLVASGYVEQDARRRYRISVKVLTLGNATLRRLVVRERARPYMRRLGEDLGQHVSLSVPCRGRAVVVDVVHAVAERGPGGFEIGSLQTFHASASGKVAAAHLSEAELDEVLAMTPLERYAPATLTDPNRLRVELDRVRREGMARTRAEKGPGVFAVAAPIVEREGRLVGVLGAMLPPDGDTPETWRRFEDAVREAATSISFALGYAAAALA